ncbi:MAG: ATP-binding protein, partial [Gammaproteobacteria bacterium]|nr:ATP-binding protein [Gammaproteobacteria bacterium]
MSESENFFLRANEILDRLEGFLPGNNKLDFNTKSATCWSYNASTNKLEAITRQTDISLDDLLCIDKQKLQLIQNTQQFISGLTANNALLWGPRGTGKSSLIKALLNHFQGDGLRLIEIQRDNMKKLPEICDLLYDRADKYVLFCDDLSFEEHDQSYKVIKVMLDGSVKQTPENVLIYATSNRRHLIPEKMQENIESGFVDGELHYGDTVEEKLSLSERFGLWIAFHPFNQEQYLTIVRYWLGKHMGTDNPLTDEQFREALQWALNIA